MMEQLLQTGRRILVHSRHLALLPRQPGLPAAYVLLLLDPVERLTDLCGTLFSETVPAEPSAETMPPVERHAARDFAEQFSHGLHVPTSRTPVWPAFSASDEREAVRPQSTSAATRTTQSQRATRSRLPLSLVSSTSKPFASAAPQRTPFDRIERTHFPTQQEASLTSSAGSVVPTESLLLPSGARARTESDYSFHPGDAGDAVSAPPGIENRTRDAALFPEESFVNHVTSPTSAASTPRPIVERAQGSLLPIARAHESLLPSRDSGARLQPHEEPQPSSVNFTPGPSQLASVLNANLTANGRVPSQSPSLEATGASQPADAPTGSFTPTSSLQPRDASPFDKPELSRSDAFAAPDRIAPENRWEDSGSTRGADAPLVESVLEQLYERLRLEYLRTYGTSGE